MRRLVVLVTVILGLGAFQGTARAGVIQGEISFGGGVQVTALTTNWFEYLQFVSNNGTPSNPLDDTFVGVNPQVAVITNSSLTNGGVVVGGLQPPNQLHESNLNLLTMTPGTALNVNFFEYGLNATNINFVLNYISPCPGAAYTCFGSSPYGFVANTNGSTTVALQMSGTVFDTATPTLVSTWSGLWTTNINASITDIFGVIEGGGTISQSYSATKITAAAVPEPATLLTFGLGALVLAGASRRRRKA